MLNVEISLFIDLQRERERERGFDSNDGIVERDLTSSERMRERYDVSCLMFLTIEFVEDRKLENKETLMVSNVGSG